MVTMTYYILVKSGANHSFRCGYQLITKAAYIVTLPLKHSSYPNEQEPKNTPLIKYNYVVKNNLYS